jgi:hypothetical protein
MQTSNTSKPLSSDKFFHLTNANDLVGVFTKIGTNLIKLRAANSVCRT